MWCLVAALVCSPSFAAEGARELTLLFDQGGPEEVREETLDAIRAQLTRVPVRLNVQTLPSGTPFEAMVGLAREGSLGAFWVSLKAPDAIGLYFLAPGGERVLSRWVSTAERAPAVAVEEIATIVRSSVQSLLQSKDFVHEMAPAAVPLPSAPAPERVAILRLNAAYEGATFSPQAQWVSGLHLGVAVQLTPSIHLGLGYTAFPVMGVASADRALALNIARHPVELIAGWRGGTKYRFGLDGAARADVINRVTQATSADFMDAGPSTRVLFSLSARGVAGVRVGPWAELFITAGVEGVLNRFNFVAGVSPSLSEPVVAPWAWRAVASAGANVAFF